MHNNRYTFLFAIGLSVITAFILVGISQSLKERQDVNVALDTKSSILKSLLIVSDNKEEIEGIYNTNITELVLNNKGETIEGAKVEDVKLKDEITKNPDDRALPIYIYENEKKEKKYVIPMRGVGLWGPIWGYVAINQDFNTVYGSFFDHKSETPGLGAEISELAFQKQFEGKKIMDTKNSFESVHVVKTSAKVEYGTEHRVDGISGGTITSNGVDEMLKNCIEPYLAYFQKVN